MVTRRTGGKQSEDKTSPNPQPHKSQPIPRENRRKLADFESLLRSLITTGNNPNSNRTQFLHFHLLDIALQFFKTQQATRDKIDASATTMRNHYCNTNSRELHKLQLHNSTFDHKNGNPEDFVLQVQIKATRAYCSRGLKSFRYKEFRSSRGGQC